jgi:hypothetical protein
MRLHFGLELLTEKDATPDKPKFDASKFPMVAQIMLGKVFTFVCDPEVVQDIYVTKSKFLTKSQSNADFYEQLAKTMFAF